jgi:hypothetical protein
MTTTLSTSLAGLIGHWRGRNQVWLPGEPARVSDTIMTISTAAQGRFALMQYTWADGDNPQDGLLLIGPRRRHAEGIRAVWIDSWHMGDDVMICRGEADESGKVSLTGTYSVPPGQDWGWQIDVIPAAENEFRLLMFNLTPEGVVYPAVEAVYTREAANP